MIMGGAPLAHRSGTISKFVNFWRFRDSMGGAFIPVKMQKKPLNLFS